MPKKAPGGSETVELLEYLFGPGERDEHTDPRLIAAWDPDLPCPARDPDRMTLAGLALLLDAPVEALRGPRPAAEWSEVAAAMVHAAGIAARGDEHACRWVAVRHADDHIHIAATLARQDGRHPRVRGDIPNMHTAARAFEARWGLTPMSPLDRTARRCPATGEAEKAARRGLAETARESLQRTVRIEAALAQGDADFLDRLRDAGLRVRECHGDDGTLLGYAVTFAHSRRRSAARPASRAPAAQPPRPARAAQLRPSRQVFRRRVGHERRRQCSGDGTARDTPQEFGPTAHPAEPEIIPPATIAYQIHPAVTKDCVPRQESGVNISSGQIQNVPR
ncbi:hypothetical protein ACFQ7B_38505 [Streptomyces erythrochromogenes]